MGWIPQRHWLWLQFSKNPMKFWKSWPIGAGLFSEKEVGGKLSPHPACQISPVSPRQSSPSSKSLSVSPGARSPGSKSPRSSMSPRVRAPLGDQEVGDGWGFPRGTWGLGIVNCHILTQFSQKKSCVYTATLPSDLTYGSLNHDSINLYPSANWGRSIILATSQRPDMGWSCWPWATGKLAAHSVGRRLLAYLYMLEIIYSPWTGNGIVVTPNYVIWILLLYLLLVATLFLPLLKLQELCTTGMRFIWLGAMVSWGSMTPSIDGSFHGQTSDQIMIFWRCP